MLSYEAPHVILLVIVAVQRTHHIRMADDDQSVHFASGQHSGRPVVGDFATCLLQLFVVANGIPLIDEPLTLLYRQCYRQCDVGVALARCDTYHTYVRTDRKSVV